MADAINGCYMKIVVNENQVSGRNALKVPSGTLKGPLNLDISWHVAPAQIVAILDLSGNAGEHRRSPLAAAGTVANLALQECNYV